MAELLELGKCHKIGFNSVADQEGVRTQKDIAITIILEIIIGNLSLLYITVLSGY